MVKSNALKRALLPDRNMLEGGWSDTVSGNYNGIAVMRDIPLVMYRGMARSGGYLDFPIIYASAQKH